MDGPNVISYAGMRHLSSTWRWFVGKTKYSKSSTARNISWEHTSPSQMVIKLIHLHTKHDRITQFCFFLATPTGKFGMKVKRCFSFSDTNNTVQLVDDNGWAIFILLKFINSEKATKIWRNLQILFEITIMSFSSHFSIFVFSLVLADEVTKIPRILRNMFIYIF